jgi:hypothetical protein
MFDATDYISYILCISKHDAEDDNSVTLEAPEMLGLLMRFHFSIRNDTRPTFSSYPSMPSTLLVLGIRDLPLVCPAMAAPDAEPCNDLYNAFTPHSHKRT